MPSPRTVFATLPVQMEYPEEMAVDIEAVLGGEYEAGFDGEKLSIVDLGANVGAFSIWASLRWPGSVIHAYEPHPGTFAMLSRNVASYANVTCHEAAVYPGGRTRGLLYQHYAGDGESGLVDYIGETFRDIQRDLTVSVAVVDPGTIPACDVLKVDVEGAEATVLAAMDVSTISLILVEYQNLANRQAIEQQLAGDFLQVHADQFPWSEILGAADYQPQLAGNSYGHVFFANRARNRLRPASGSTATRRAGGVPLERVTLREVLSLLPGTLKRAITSRLRGS